MKYLDILKINKSLLDELKEQDVYEVCILSNITVSQIKEIIEFKSRVEGVNTHVHFGDYDNIVKDSFDNNNDCVIIFWELDNIVDEFGYKFDSINESQMILLEEQVKCSIELVFNNLSKVPVVFFNMFDPLFCEKFIENNNPILDFANRLNKFLSNIVPTNTTLIDIKSIKSISSNKKSIDYRFYNISKSLYTVDFFINYANYITPAILSLNGKTKKALIFDCDNTLWGGVIGEDGIDNIKMSNNGEGRFYREVQYLTKALVKKGVIVGLCSKNDLDDVDRVFKTHKDMVLTDSDISIKKVNWKDKVENIISISKDLNIGLDSIVFIDDSNFEINNIVDRLPDISVFKVPDKIYKYPAIFRELTSLFYSHSVSDEDKNKTNFYTTDIARKNKRNSYKDITMYLKSLNLTLNVYTDLISQVPRISQLTQKTNQFNLTTKRYSGEDIKKFISSDNYKVYTFDLSDNFGSYGLTGLCIIELLDNCVYIDSFLMSCRVIGRNVEYNFVYFVINSLLEQGFCEFYSSYKKTEKNKQVEKFWEKIGFKLHEIENDGKFKYKLLKKNYNDHQLDYITINKYEK